MEQRFFHLSFVVLFILLMVIRGYYHRQSIKYGGKAEFKENKWIRIVIAVPLVYFLVRYMIEPEFLAWADFSIYVWLQWLGLVLGVLSIFLTVWIHVNLSINFSSLLHVREGHTLVTTGPYKWVRHPMYTVLFVHFLSILLLTRNWIIGLVPIVIFVLVVAGRLKNEEKLMTETFGDEYRRYMEHTGRFLPGI